MKKIFIFTLLFSFTFSQAFTQDSTKISKRKKEKRDAAMHRNSGDTTIVNPNTGSKKPHAIVNTNSTLTPSGTTSGNNPNTQFVMPLNKKKIKTTPATDTTK